MGSGVLLTPALGSAVQMTPMHHDESFDLLSIVKDNCDWFVQVTGSDDKTWKMWHLPKGDLIMSGEGHTDWLAGVAFHPKVLPFAAA